MDDSTALIPADRIEQAIVLLRGHKVLLDSDLADLYGVETRTLNQAVKRNALRFPQDFMFQLTNTEWARLQPQVATSTGRGGRRTPPFAFTEQGVAMLSSVLNSDRAVAVNIEIMRAFVRLRQALATQEELAERLRAVERVVGQQGNLLEDVVKAIRQIIALPPSPTKRIGFREEPPPP